MILKLMEYLWPGDALVTWQIRKLLQMRLQEISEGGRVDERRRLQALIKQLDGSPRAIATDDANAQHYEVPTEFYQLVLGPHLKYSCGLWTEGVATLEESELKMLELYCERAQLQDGQRILDLGCGWGSLSLYLAKRYPRSRILGISNSNTQREAIMEMARQRDLPNLQIKTCDVNDLVLEAGAFDRILSVEMLEHVRNYRSVFALLRGALAEKGKLFLHVFAHHRVPYAYEPSGDQATGADWMQEEFFTGGMMPSFDLFLNFTSGLRREDEWVVEGHHYYRTCMAWLEAMRSQKREIQALFRQKFPKEWRRKWLGWQLFFLACAELFRYNQGQEWMVHHSLWSKDAPG